MAPSLQRRWLSDRTRAIPGARRRDFVSVMVWSLSKDDDGLDSVLPAADSPMRPSFPGPASPGAASQPLPPPSVRSQPGYPRSPSHHSQAPAPRASSAPLPPAPQRSFSSAPFPPAPQRASSAPLPPAPPRPPSVYPQGGQAFGGSSSAAQALSLESPSVVVDPTSQVPEVPGVRRAKRVEPTEILKGRRLDALRAEVAQRRKAHRRKQLGILLFWGMAGAVALCLGWLAGRAFTPDAEINPEDAAQESPTESSQAAPLGDAGANEAPPAPAAPSTPPHSRTQEAAPTPPPSVEKEPAPKPAKARPTDTFTLDDLPIE